MFPTADLWHIFHMVAAVSHTIAPPSPHTGVNRPCKAASPASREAARHDATLVARFQAGDQAAFDEINARYRAKIAAYVCAMLHNHADAEEVAQDTLIRAHRNLATFRGECSLTRWMHAIALNLARNRYGYLLRRRNHMSQSLDCPLEEGNPATFADLAASDEPGPAREAITQDFTDLVTRCIERLTPEHRDVLDHRVLRCAPYDEIAAATGITVGTVKSRLARARTQLRGLMVLACPECRPESGPWTWFETARSATWIQRSC